MSARGDRWLILAIAVLAGLVFLPALHGPWIFDDHQLIEGNLEVHGLAAVRVWFTTDFWHGAGLGEHLHYWRPLINASYAIDWSIGGGRPLPFHVANMVAHAAVAALVFVTLRRWTASSWAAFAAAMLWAVHPTKAENVAWISGRTDILCMAFLLLAAAGIARRLVATRARRSGLALEAVATVAAYMCKELAVVIPVFAAVEAWVAAGRPALDRTVVRPLVRAALPQLVVAATYVAVHAIAMPIGGAAVARGAVDHVRAVLETYGRFIALTFAPHQLSIQHALVRSHDSSIEFSTPYVLLGALALVTTLAAAVMLRRRWPAVTVGIAVFLATIAPTLNIAQTNQQTLVAERFLYVPTLGLALMLAAALATLPAVAQRRVQLLVAAIVIALSAQALSRAADFADENAFWTRELRLHPTSAAGISYVLGKPIGKHVIDEIAQAGSRDADQATFAADVLDVLVATVTDRDPEVLRALYTTAGELLAHRTASARFDALGLTVVIDMSDGFAEHLPRVAGRLHAARAELAARGGDPVAARAAAAAEGRACGECDHASITIALAEARAAAFGPPADADAGFADAIQHAGTHTDLITRITEARRAAAAAQTSKGVAQLKARSSELAALGLWGAAYKVVQPQFDALVSTDFAKLAFRAGQVADAADALASVLPTDQIRGTLEGWARELGWIEPATSADGPSSP